MSVPASEPAKPVETPTPATPPVPDPAAAAKPAEPVTPPAADPAKPVADPDPKAPVEGKPADPAPAEPAKPAENVPVVPEKYDLKIPENSLLDAAAVEAVSLFAKENKLTNEQAQVVLEREHNAAQAGVETFRTRAEAISQQWLEEAKADKEIGGDKFKETVATANDALVKLFPGMEIKKIMDISGLGNHPTVLKGFAKIGAMLKNDTMHQPGTQPAAKGSRESRLYDNPTSPKSR